MCVYIEVTHPVPGPAPPRSTPSSRGYNDHVFFLSPVSRVRVR